MTTEDGATACVIGAEPTLSMAARFLPAVGLAPMGSPTAGSGPAAADLLLELVVPRGGSGHRSEPMLRVDGTARLGGWAAFESELSLFAAEHLVGRIAVHAGLVVHGDVVIVLPGASFAGKSTLCSALGALGAQVRSDEYAIIDPATGLVAGWRRPLRRRRGDGGIDRVELPHGGGPPERPTLVASLRYSHGAHEGWRRMGPGETALSLLANAVAARRHPELALAACRSVAESAVGIAGDRGEAAVAARQLIGGDGPLASPPSEGATRGSRGARA